MAYRIPVFQDDQKLLDLAANGPLADTREAAVDAVNMLKGDYVLILDEAEQVIDRMKCSA